MANLQVIDGNASTKYISASGAGSDGDPFITGHHSTWVPKGDERVDCNATTTALTIPADSLMAMVNAELGEVRYKIDAVANATSPGRIPEDSTTPIFLSGAANAAVYGAAGVYANIIYYG